MTSDRRSFQRFRVKEGVLVTSGHVLGPVLNLGLGGMCFEYFNGEQLDSDPMDVGIFFSEGRFLLSGIRSTTIYDTIVVSGQGFLPLIRKRRSIRFIDLTPAQRREIKKFLAMHTMGPA